MRLHDIFITVTGILVILLFFNCKSDSNHLNTNPKPHANDYISQKRKITLGKKQYDMELGTIYLPENRGDSMSRLIEIPVKIIKSPSRSAIPVFYLSGGPGSSNLHFSPPGWLVENYDMVFVGYRGIDGNVRLDMPEFRKAISAMKDPLNKESLAILAHACDSGLARIKNEGIDTRAYTILDVVDDLEAVREVLDYETINLLSQSYGTRVAYLYGLKYPARVHRSTMLAVNPPGCFVWEPSLIEKQLNYYSGLWRKDATAIEKSKDIFITMLLTPPSLFFNKDWGANSRTLATRSNKPLYSLST